MSTYIVFRLSKAADKNAISLIQPIVAATMLAILRCTPPDVSQLSQRGLQVPLYKTKSSPQCKWVVLLFRNRVMAEMLSSSSEWEWLQSKSTLWYIFLHNKAIGSIYGYKSHIIKCTNNCKNLINKFHLINDCL